MVKRSFALDSSAGEASSSHAKKFKKAGIAAFNPNKVATKANADAVVANPPLDILLAAVKDAIAKPAKGGSVIYWMRMCDLRLTDNRALAQASAQAKHDKIPLVALFVISPQDYQAHDRSARRIDFTLRNLAILKESLGKLHIPLNVVEHQPRITLPNLVVDLAASYSATQIFGNIEYELDELRRDVKVCELAKSKGIKPIFVHDKYVVEPGILKSKSSEKPYAVYSPYQKAWMVQVNNHMARHLGQAPDPQPNDVAVRQSDLFGPLFDREVPTSVSGYELSADDKLTMEETWPAGTADAQDMLTRFLNLKARACQMGAVSPFSMQADLTVDAFAPANGKINRKMKPLTNTKVTGKVSAAPTSTEKDKHSRIVEYSNGRNNADKDTTSRLSPYLSAGVISIRECVRRAMNINESGEGGGHIHDNGGPGVWVKELAWRDFYAGILTAFPRVSMGRPYNEKYADVVWETDDDMLTRWKEGKTGVPIVDAGMRQLNKMGWMHNRLRMITAMFLTKDLMIDWRLGERYFMENLIDGDLASNNGGWQWSSSTGTDSQPYFRIFNPYLQSVKADPSGDYIRHFVPELAKLRGPELHDPPAATADRLGYPRPIVNHSEVRERAIRRYKNPGEE